MKATKTKPKLTLTLTKPRHITKPEEMDLPPDELMLRLSREVFDAAVALAERRGFRVPGRTLHCRHLPAGHVVALARSITEALAELAVPVAPTARRRLPDHLDTYFAQPAHEKSLLKLLAFLGTGGELSAVEE